MRAKNGVTREQAEGGSGERCGPVGLHGVQIMYYQHRRPPSLTRYTLFSESPNQRVLSILIINLLL